MPERREGNKTEGLENTQQDNRDIVGERRERPSDEETWDGVTRFVQTSHHNRLNEELALLDKPGGLNILHARYCKKK